MRPSNNLENKTRSGTLKFHNSGPEFFRTTTEIQFGPDVCDESRFVMTFLTIFRGTEIEELYLC